MEELALEERSLREVPASEILAKIEKREPVEYDRIRIESDVNIDELNLPMHDKYFVIDPPITITNSQFDESIVFSEALFKESVNFAGTRFNYSINFNYALFKKDVTFEGAYFNRAVFLGTQFVGKANFYRTIFKRVNLDFAKFDGNANFFRTQFEEFAEFYNVQFNGKANFLETKFSRENASNLFINTKFRRLKDEETACRKAKKLLEGQGNKESADNYFYREMEAKRKQKPWYIRYPEFTLVQLIFGYGVHPFWLMYWWVLIVTIFALIYEYGNGISGAAETLDYIKISFAIAIAPGYIAAIINPGSAGYRLIDEYQIVAMTETIVGTFLWAAFIATFARKYMR